MTAIVNYTYDQVATIKIQIDTIYSKLACKIAKKQLYNTMNYDKDLMKEIFMYKWAIDGYSVYPNGIPYEDNLLTPEEFTCIATRIKQLSC